MAEKLKGLLDSAKAKLTGLLGDFPQGFNAGAVAGFPGWAGDMAYMADTARLALTGADQQAAPEDYVGTTDYIAKQAGYPVPKTLSGQLGAAVGGLMSPGPGDLAKFAPILAAIPPALGRGVDDVPANPIDDFAARRAGKAKPYREAVEADESASRAVVGGEVGINGSFYKGGQFLPNTMERPGKFKIGKKWVPAKGFLVAPGERATQPTATSSALFQTLNSYSELAADGTLSLRQGLRTPQGADVTPDTIAGESGLTFGDMIEAYNRGERWYDRAQSTVGIEP